MICSETAFLFSTPYKSCAVLIPESHHFQSTVPPPSLCTCRPPVWESTPPSTSCPLIARGPAATLPFLGAPSTPAASGVILTLRPQSLSCGAVAALLSCCLGADALLRARGARALEPGCPGLNPSSFPCARRFPSRSSGFLVCKKRGIMMVPTS